MSRGIVKNTGVLCVRIGNIAREVVCLADYLQNAEIDAESVDENGDDGPGKVKLLQAILHANQLVEYMRSVADKDIIRD